VLDLRILCPVLIFVANLVALFWVLAESFDLFAPYPSTKARPIFICDIMLGLLLPKLLPETTAPPPA
jgi:hypothetical protein